ARASISEPSTPGSMSNTPVRPCTTTALLWQNSLWWISTPSATCLSTGLLPLVGQLLGETIVPGGDAHQLTIIECRFDNCLMGAGVAERSMRWQPDDGALPGD